MNKLAVPTIHMNGTSKNDLVEAIRAVRTHLQDALDAMSNISPNGRDYCVQNAGALLLAVAQHRDRVARIESVNEELMAIWEKIEDQG